MKLKLFDFGSWSIQGSQFINLPRTTSTGLGTTYYRTSLKQPVQFSNHYPHYTEELMQLYAKYRVLGIKYRLKCYSTQINQTTWIGILRDTGNMTTTSGATFNMLVEDPRMFFKSMGSVNGGRSTCTLKGYLDVAKTAGKSVSAINDDPDWGASFGYDPAKMAYIVPIITTTWPESTEPPTGMLVDYEMWLTYYVTLEDRLMPLSVN